MEKEKRPAHFFFATAGSTTRKLLATLYADVTTPFFFSVST